MDRSTDYGGRWLCLFPIHVGNPTGFENLCDNGEPSGSLHTHFHLRILRVGTDGSSKEITIGDWSMDSAGVNGVGTSTGTPTRRALFLGGVHCESKHGPVHATIQPDDEGRSLRMGRRRRFRPILGLRTRRFLPTLSRRRNRCCSEPAIFTSERYSYLASASR
jgi:hypothetical protein